MKPWKAELSLFFVTFIWGGTFIFTKLGLQDCPPSLYIILRFTIALSISLLIFGKHLSKLNKVTLRNGMILGLFFGFGFILQTYGLKFTSVSKSAFITGISVCLTPFVYWFVERKKIQIWQKLGVVVVSFGLWLFTNPDFGNLNIGDVLTLFSTIFWALYITYMDVFTRGKEEFSETVQLVTLQLVFASIVAILGFLIFELNNFSINISKNLIISLSYNGILASFLLTFIHTAVQRYTTPVKAALIFSLEPAIASIIAMIVLSEILNLREYIGGGILILGVLLSELGVFIFYIYIQILKLFKKID